MFTATLQVRINELTAHLDAFWEISIFTTFRQIVIKRDEKTTNLTKTEKHKRIICETIWNISRFFKKAFFERSRGRKSYGSRKIDAQ